MSTTIKSRFGEVRIFTSPSPYDRSVGVESTDASGAQQVRSLPRADFIAAVESELGVKVVPADAIVIERSELPPTRAVNGGVEVLGEDGWEFWGTPDERRDILAALVVNEFFAAHPPVDQAQVAALTLDIATVRHGDEPTASDLADRLVRLGWRKDGAR